MENNYGGKYNNGKSDSNDGMAFAMVMEENEKGKDVKKGNQNIIGNNGNNGFNTFSM